MAASKDDSGDWRAMILAGGQVSKGGSGQSSFHCPVDSMAALLGHLFCLHEEGISNAVWGERFYQWGVAAGISKGTLHTIVYAMLEIARTIPFVGDDESGSAAPTGTYNPTKSKVGDDKMLEFIEEFSEGDIDVAPLSSVPGLGKVTAAALGSSGDGLGSDWEPPAPGQDESYKIPITSFVALMGHLLVFHQEDIIAPTWGERMFQWGAAIGIGKTQLHPIVCALLAVAETMPCVPSNTCAGLAAFSADADFAASKSHTRADVLADFVERTADGPIDITDVPSIGPATARKFAESHFEMRT
jgi:hypothetical protein